MKFKPKLASKTSIVKAKTISSEFYRSFFTHDLMTLSAALAFYTALSLAPLLLITLSVVGLMGVDSQALLLIQIDELMGTQAAKAIQAIVENVDSLPETASFAGMVAVATLLFTASGVFAQLQSSLNVIWGVDVSESEGVGPWVKKRLLSMGLVLTLGFIAVVSLAISAILAFLFPQEGEIWKSVNFLISGVIFAGMFAVLFKFLPDTFVRWKHALIGGSVTSILFIIGKSLIGYYLGKSAVGSAYGAAGSLIVLLIWVYYSAIIAFSGAELTRILGDKQRDKERLSVKS